MQGLIIFATERANRLQSPTDFGVRNRFLPFMSCRDIEPILFYNTMNTYSIHWGRYEMNHSLIDHIKEVNLFLSIRLKSDDKYDIYL